ncbi:peptide chain release factor 1 [Candidatus Micrarchaeota archaeon]|nr:peptide chain release factor 1 [Candidatus Micrarchaeota archaeon]MBD3417983.1 peptide chain release factor 1 [Candidatus Micrarchaeota archaeon]
MSSHEKEDAISTEKLYEFRKLIKKIKGYRGSGTQMISVYIPADYPIHETSNKLKEELGQASNIKSKQTRTNVTEALEKIVNYLKMFKKTPRNGLVIFAGNISDDPSKRDVQLFSMEPPYKLSVSIYRCDSSFFLEPLENMLETRATYGIIVMDGREATIALVKGTETQIVKRVHSLAHSKIKVGGQSAMRYQRDIEEKRGAYYKKVRESANAAFQGKVKGVIVGGPGPAKEFFMKEEPLDHHLKIMGVVDTGYTDEYGIREVLAKSGEILAEQEAIKEKKLVERFIKEVVTEGLATYGIHEVIGVVESKQAETLLVSEELPFRFNEYKCLNCGHTERKVTKGEKAESLNCPECNTKMDISIDEPLVDEIIDRAHKNNVNVEVISTHTAEGSQFLNGFGGIGALLRYKKRE